MSNEFIKRRIENISNHLYTKVYNACAEFELYSLDTCQNKEHFGLIDGVGFSLRAEAAQKIKDMFIEKLDPKYKDILK